MAYTFSYHVAILLRLNDMIHSRSEETTFCHDCHAKIVIICNIQFCTGCILMLDLSRSNVISAHIAKRIWEQFANSSGSINN